MYKKLEIFRVRDAKPATQVKFWRIDMKTSEHSGYGRMAWGLLIAAFGVFFLIGNLCPQPMQVLKFWPIFLIAAGALKFLCGCSCKYFKE